MIKPVYVLLLMMAAASLGTAQTNPREFKTLVWNNSHVVSYEKRGNRILITMEMIADYTNDRKTGGPDHALLRVDVNNNNIIDREIDIAFGQRGLTDTLCTQYLYEQGTSSVCGALSSRASLKVSFAKSPFHNTPHPVFAYSIPIRELRTHSSTVGLEFRFHSAGAGTTFYPVGNAALTSLRQTLPLNLDNL